MSLVAHQLRAEQKLFWRNRESAFFVFLFPLILYALLAAVYSGDVDGIPSQDYLLVGLLGYGAANTAFAGLAIALVIRRESGILKRLRSTPLPPATYVAAVLGSTLIVFTLQTSALVALGRVLFGASLPESWAALAGAVVIGVAGFAGIGLGVASLIRSAEGASAVVNVILLPMAFLSGSFGPAASLPAFLEAVSKVLPLTYYLRIVNAAYLDGESPLGDPAALAIVFAWGAAGLAVAAWKFSWMPRER
jgi:ABC-2 type transport system permease protein